MSFGFSIGDIVLLSQLAYNLYSSLNFGRKAASRDLQELEDVLFSLRCALDHLGDVSKDVLACGHRLGGTQFREKLERMLDSCGKTLQELDDVTKKYRELGIDDGSGKKKRARERIKINWRKVRWDQEKQSLQQYREKLRSHTDAINIIVTSEIWSTTSSAESSSKTNHDKTHLLLDQVLQKPQTDPSLRLMLQEIHGILTQSRPSRPLPIRALPSADLDQRPTEISPRGIDPQRLQPSSSASIFAMHAPTIALGNAKTGVESAPGAMFSSRRPNNPVSMTREDASSPIIHDQSQLPTPNFMKYSRANHETVFQSTPHRRIEVANFAFPHYANDTPNRPELKASNKLSPYIVTLNQERQAFAVEAFEAFTQRYSKPVQPVKPAFLTMTTPTIQQLQEGLTYIFHPLVDSREDRVLSQTHDRSKDIVQWIEGLRQFANSNHEARSEHLVALLVAMNEAIEKSDAELLDMFYQASDQTKLMKVLEQLQRKSKSVRFLKELEDFQDAKSEWSGE